MELCATLGWFGNFAWVTSCHTDLGTGNNFGFEIPGCMHTFVTWYVTMSQHNFVTWYVTMSQHNFVTSIQYKQDVWRWFKSGCRSWWTRLRLTTIQFNCSGRPNPAFLTTYNLVGVFWHSFIQWVLETCFSYNNSSTGWCHMVQIAVVIWMSGLLLQTAWSEGRAWTRCRTQFL